MYVLLCMYCCVCIVKYVSLSMYRWVCIVLYVLLSRYADVWAVVYVLFCMDCCVCIFVFVSLWGFCYECIVLYVLLCMYFCICSAVYALFCRYCEVCIVMTVCVVVSVLWKTRYVLPAIMGPSPNSCGSCIPRLTDNYLLPLGVVDCSSAGNKTTWVATQNHGLDLEVISRHLLTMSSHWKTRELNNWT